MKKDNSTHEFEKALQLFLDSFLGVNPKETWPTWFRTSTTYGGHKDSEGIWRFSFTGIPSSVLGVGESWEEKNDGYILVKTDPETKERSYVISNTPSEVIVFFEAIIDLNSGKVSVVSSKNISEIDGRDLLPLRK
ncbi:hypothetical protein [Undibacterium luofuense]|uniref:Uncharacterized protein n=1 Tax=Undibacterium luofuense TaxID=2828733 RepID=A0A941I7C5_9BURK|nr:hypothetical protein [Undibacterium luofuense]MBR7783671.1 hypothetical protein [Undibacterium luofuense]